MGTSVAVPLVIQETCNKYERMGEPSGSFQEFRFGSFWFSFGLVFGSCWFVAGSFWFAIGSFWLVVSSFWLVVGSFGSCWCVRFGSMEDDRNRYNQYAVMPGDFGFRSSFWLVVNSFWFVFGCF